MRCGEARPGEGLQEERGAHAVERRVDDAQVSRRGAGKRIQDRLQVGLRHRTAELVAAVAQRQRRRRAGPGDARGDALVDRRGDLCAVAEVDLVAVVLARVVAGGDHHARGALQMAHREGQQGSGRQRRQPAGAQAGPTEHGGGLEGEASRPVPRVVAHHHAGFGSALDLLEQVAGQTGARPADGGDVHARRPGPERASEPGRSESQLAAEALGELVPGAPVDQLAQLGLRLGIGIVGNPTLHARAQRAGGHGVRHAADRLTRVWTPPVTGRRKPCAPSR